jgi:dUTP pyrophosphatase
MMEICHIQFKKLVKGAQLPEKAKEADSGWDLRCYEDFALHPEEPAKIIKTGLQLANITPGFELQVRSRSGIAAKHSAFVVNSPGTVDNGYRGEICVIMKSLFSVVFFKAGDRIAQLVPIEIPKSTVAWCDVVTETDRGAGGFGSTGKS